jgi:hypothetical protein
VPTLHNLDLRHSGSREAVVMGTVSVEGGDGDGASLTSRDVAPWEAAVREALREATVVREVASREAAAMVQRRQ